MSYAPPRRRAHTSQRATGRFGVCSGMTTLALGLALLIPSGAAAVAPPASAGWPGRAVQNPQPQTYIVTTAAAFPSGWSAGPVRLGTGFRHLGGSERVREVQKRLWTAGYRPGPVDGLFGPQTQAAVQWFQLKHGLAASGVVDARTLGLLRDRTWTPADATPEPVRGAAANGTVPPQQPADRSQTPGGGHGTGSAPVA